ncbi:MAG TPA: hypothetical protein VK279_07715 [Solirubrobacteraceae bacterium]|nr:hypothetical protein [Solirubrobacteraceae bacterium]
MANQQATRRRFGGSSAPGRTAGRRAGRPTGRRPGRRPDQSGAPNLAFARRRRQPQKSGAAKALAAVTSKLPGGGSKRGKAKSTGAAGALKGKGKGPAGIAALAAAAVGAGVAFKNRDKVGGAMKRKGQDDEPQVPETPVDVGPVPGPLPSA